MSVKAAPWIDQLQGYVPGEQPKIHNIVKLNTNECPYPPAPEVEQAILASLKNGHYNKYPNPLSAPLREEIAKDFQLSQDCVLIGNGSDEVLRLICHAFLEPNKDSIGMLNPTYSLYEVLASMFGGNTLTYPVSASDYTIPDEAVNADVKVFFLPNPNPPIGTLYPLETLRKLAEARPNRLLVIDEAYVDFAPNHAVQLVSEYKNVVVTRTFSKSYSLAGLRVGFVIGNPDIIAVIDKIRDSYNINSISQAAAWAAWQAKDYLADMVKRINATKAKFAAELVSLGFVVPESHGNFVFARHQEAERLFHSLREAGIIVRYFTTPSLKDGIRISIGTEEEMEKVLSEIKTLL